MTFLLGCVLLMALAVPVGIGYAIWKDWKEVRVELAMTAGFVVVAWLTGYLWIYLGRK